VTKKKALKDRHLVNIVGDALVPQHVVVVAAHVEVDDGVAQEFSKLERHLASIKKAFFFVTADEAKEARAVVAGKHL
jgi:hypothetical protein